jgi:hypothetical protein
METGPGRLLSGPSLTLTTTSHCFTLRTKLWTVYGYGNNQLIHDKIQIMWQTYMEIETIGWPVAHLESFSDPVLHSHDCQQTPITGGVQIVWTIWK